MCLLAVAFRFVAEVPLIVAANRDEWRTRPATGMGVLQEREPRILGGRDELAGGTWLAVNELGVVAALTNRPEGGRDDTKRSRGELPIRLARHRSAAEAASSFAGDVHNEDYNPCWVLVGDRESLHYLVVEGSGAPAHRELPPGLHVLENRPLDSDSPKAEWVRNAMEVALHAPAPERALALTAVLRSHEIPERAAAHPDPARTPATEAACVHAGDYGTRSASIIVLPPIPAARPVVLAADGPLCEAELVDAGALWTAKTE